MNNKVEKGKDTKRSRRRWGSDGIRGITPGPHVALNITNMLFVWNTL